MSLRAKGPTSPWPRIRLEGRERERLYAGQSESDDIRLEVSDVLRLSCMPDADHPLAVLFVPIHPDEV